jgi:hypothetical protein
MSKLIDIEGTRYNDRIEDNIIIDINIKIGMLDLLKFRSIQHVESMLKQVEYHFKELCFYAEKIEEIVKNDE